MIDYDEADFAVGLDWLEQHIPLDRLAEISRAHPGHFAALASQIQVSIDQVRAHETMLVWALERVRELGRSAP